MSDTLTVLILVVQLVTALLAASSAYLSHRAALLAAEAREAAARVPLAVLEQAVMHGVVRQAGDPGPRV